MKNTKLIYGFLFFFLAISLHAQTPVIEIPDSSDFKTSPDVVLQSLDVNVKVIGNISTTQMTLVFKNNSTKLLEGRLTFPLPEEVTVSGYALDINGKLRNAVAVEKERAREVFESIQKKNVDPGLLEKVEGNNFRTRIYPLPINGIRTVQITYNQELSSSNVGLTYYLPLNYNKTIPSFHIKVLVSESSKQPTLAESPDGSFTFDKKGNQWQAEITKENFEAKSSLRINLPKNEQFQTILQAASDNNFYFLAQAAITANSVKKQAPKSIGIIWDNSLSGLERNHDKEFDFLNDYFQNIQNVQVSLAFINNEWNEAKQFSITNGNWTELKTALQTVIYDGGTDLGLLKTLKTDEYLFFTDGLSTFGNLKCEINKPVYTIVSSERADFSLLKLISIKTGGQLFNLNESTNKDIQQKIGSEKQLQFLGIKPNSAVSEVYPSIPTIVNGHISIAGILNQTQTEITLLFGYDGVVSREEKIMLHSANQVTDDWDVDQMWAQKKVTELDIFYEKNKQDISNIGKQFGIVTRNTSLMVLEGVNDYLKYNIVPPTELQEEYYRIQKQGDYEKELRISDLVKKAEEMTADLKKWWKHNYNPLPIKVNSSGKPLYPGTLRRPQVMARPASGRGPDYAPQHVASQVTPPSPPQADEVKYVRPVVSRKEEESSNQESKKSDGNLGEKDKASIRSAQYSTSQAIQGRVAGVNVTQSTSLGATTNSDTNKNEESLGKISIEDFKSDKAYIKKISLCKTTECAYEKYLELRKEYLHTPLFYLDVANYFYSKKEDKIALKILSSITDLEIENEELYKLLAYKLKQENQSEKLLFVTKKVLEWRPFDAQSYRDYALALEDNGQYQLALDNLYKVLTQTYTEEIADRDTGIEETIIMEINELIANHPEVKTKGISKKIIADLPVAIRVVLNWNKDDTDIDLWIYDPRGEDCYYGKPKTELGGRLSNDFTAGFGPEQFLLKKAVKGKYKIKTNFFGDTQKTIAGGTSLMAEVYLYYGSGKQERKIVVLQSENKPNKNNNQVLVGQFEF